MEGILSPFLNLPVSMALQIDSIICRYLGFDDLTFILMTFFKVFDSGFAKTNLKSLI